MSELTCPRCSHDHTLTDDAQVAEVGSMKGAWLVFCPLDGCSCVISPQVASAWSLAAATERRAAALEAQALATWTLAYHQRPRGMAPDDYAEDVMEFRAAYTAIGRLFAAASPVGQREGQP